MLLAVLQLKPGGLVLELSTVDALTPRTVPFFEVTPLALQKRTRRRVFGVVKQRLGIRE